MKRTLIAVLAVFILVACSKESGIVDTASDGSMQTIILNVEPFDDQTKGAVSPAGKFSWNAGDQLGVYPVATTLGKDQKSQQIMFRINSEAGTSSATFTGTGWGLILDGTYKYFSYYPYNSAAKYNNVTVSYTTGYTQKANNNTDHLSGKDYLCAPQIQPDIATSATFTFKHISAIMKFEVTVPEDAKSKAFKRLDVTVPTPLFTTAGTYDPSTATESAAPGITPTKTTEKLTLKLNNIVPDDDGKLTLFFIVAPVAIKGQQLSIKLVDSQNTEYTCTYNASSDISAGKIKRYPCEVTQSGPTAPVSIDLSAAGTANCYVVNGYNKYKFFAKVKGNGVVPEGLEGADANPSLAVTNGSAAIVWETVNTSEAPSKNIILRDVELLGDSIYFTATGVNGNALIALKDDNGSIVWSWHIWAGDFKTQEYPNGTVMMDRNLGALSATEGDANTCGLLYQWGRPCPFRGAAAFKGTIMATNPYNWGVIDGQASLANSAANPTSYFKRSSSPYNWLSGYGSTMQQLWGKGTINGKTMYDPCPVGWKVPAKGAWSDFTTSNFLVKQNGWAFIVDSLSLNAYYPLAGWYGAVSGLNVLDDVDNAGFYHSTDLSVSTSQNYILFFVGKTLTTNMISPCSYAKPVRPCRDSN